MDIVDIICELYEDEDICKIIIDLILISIKSEEIDEEFNKLHNVRLTIINKQSLTGMVSYFLSNLLKNNNYEGIEIGDKLWECLMEKNNQLYNLLQKYNINIKELNKMRKSITTIITVFSNIFSEKYEIFKCVNDTGYIITNDLVTLYKIGKFIEDTLLTLAYSVYDCNFSKNNDFIDRLTNSDKDNNNIIQEMINRLSRSVDLFSLDFFKYFDIKAITITKFLKYSFDKKLKYFIDTSINVKNIFHSITKYINIYINTTLGLIIYLTSEEECMSISPELSNNIKIISTKIDKEKLTLTDNDKQPTKTKIIGDIDIENENIFNEELEDDFTTMAICLTNNQKIELDDNEFENSDTLL